MLRVVSTLLIHHALSVTVVQDPKENITQDLFLLLKKTFPDLAGRKKRQELLLTINQLLESLTQEEITVLIKYSANLDILLRVKEKIIDSFCEANILDQVKILFTDKASMLYTNENYFQCLVEFVDYLKEMNLLTPENIGLFFASETSLKCFAEVKFALILMQVKELNASQYHLQTVLTFPKQATLIASLLIQREKREELKNALSESEYCYLISSYFKDHTEDVTVFGFNNFLAGYQKDKMMEKSKEFWISAFQSLTEKSDTSAPAYTYKM